MCCSQQPEQYGWRSLSLGKNPACLGLGSDWSEGWGREESKCEPKTTKHFKFVDDDLQELSKELCTKEHRYDRQMGSEESPSMEKCKKLKLPCPREPTENYPPANPSSSSFLLLFKAWQQTTPNA